MLVVQTVVQQGPGGEFPRVPRVSFDPAVQLPDLLVGELAVEIAVDEGPRIVGHARKPSWAAFLSTHSRNISRIRWSALATPFADMPTTGAINAGFRSRS